MVGSPHLTAVDKERDAIQRRTPRGAASWSTGPNFCNQCVFWKGKKTTSVYAPQPCQKFRQMAQIKTKALTCIDGNTPSCKFFEPLAKPPAPQPTGKTPPALAEAFGVGPASYTYDDTSSDDDEVPF